MNVSPPTQVEMNAEGYEPFATAPLQATWEDLQPQKDEGVTYRLLAASSGFLLEPAKRENCQLILTKILVMYEPKGKYHAYHLPKN